MLRKRGNKWYYTIETYDEYGNRKRVERVGTEDKVETRKLAMKAQAEYETTLRIRAGQNITYGKVLDQWLASLPDSGLKVNTIKRYQSIVHVHLRPSLGRLVLKRITPRHLQEYLNSVPLGHESVNSIASAIKKSFAYAVVMCQYLEHSPADYLKVPRKMTVGTEGIAFSPDEMETIFSQFRRSDMRTAIYLSYYTGLRLGECCALTWDNVDLRNNEIYVCATLINDGGWMVQEIPKTKSSIRTVQIPAKLHEYLSEERLLAMTTRMKYGSYYTNTNFVCRHENGRGLTPDNIRYFNQWCKNALGHGSFHSLRHTYATMLLEHGADLELVSKQLGHSSIVITAKVYSHVLEKRKDKLVKIMDAAL